MASPNEIEENHASCYDAAKEELFNVITAQSGIPSVQMYWNSFRQFIIGQLSKEEFDIIVNNLLGVDQAHLHNRLVALMLNRIDSRKPLISDYRSDLAREIFNEFTYDNIVSEQKNQINN